MNNPFDRKTDPLNHDIFERFFTHIDIVKKRKEFAEELTKEILRNIDNNLKNLTPDLMVNFNMVYKELTLMIKEHNKTIKNIENKSKKLFESSSLTEEVFKTRDEIKFLKKKIDKLNSGLRNLSKMADFLEDEN